jgi:hypothetical protein
MTRWRHATSFAFISCGCLFVRVAAFTLPAKHMLQHRVTILQPAQRRCCSVMAAEPPKQPAQKNMGSYYRRPSAALERGGGFFVPGLEGYKLRAVMGALVLVLFAANR